MVVLLGCEALLSRQELMTWAATHSVLWYYFAKHKADKKEADVRYWGMLQDGWFTD